MRVKSNINDLKVLHPTKVFFPSNVTFEIIYHTYPDNRLKLLDAQLRLENFDYMKTKDQVEGYFRQTFVDPPTKSLFDTSLYSFTYDKYTNIFMGDFNFILENVYSKTAQFKSYFEDYFSYKDAKRTIEEYEERSKANGIKGKNL